MLLFFQESWGYKLRNIRRYPAKKLRYIVICENVNTGKSRLKTAANFSKNSWNKQC